jgi:N-acetylglutamate synthase-like GNAT family acetyltransferase
MTTDAGTGTSVAIRAATAADIETLVPLINDAYRKSESNVFPETTRTERSDLAGRIGEVLVAERDGRIAGCLHFVIDGDVAHFGMLAADVSLHGSGIGSALIAHVEEQARAAGCRLMRIEVVKEGVPDRIAYYGRRGYRVTREHDGQTWNGGADWGAAIPWHMVDMEKAL